MERKIFTFEAEPEVETQLEREIRRLAKRTGTSRGHLKRFVNEALRKHFATK